MAASTEAQVATLLTTASDSNLEGKKRLDALLAFEQLVEGRSDLFEPQFAAAINFTGEADERIREWAIGFMEYMLWRAPLTSDQRESRIL